MAETPTNGGLGTAALVLTVDDAPLRAGLQEARRLIESTSADIRVGVRESAQRGRSSSVQNEQSPVRVTQRSVVDSDTTRRFNLRSTTARLEEIARDVASLSEGKQLNLRSSWTQALAALESIKSDIDAIAATKSINLNSNWEQALSELNEIDTQLKSIDSGKKLNIASHWEAALVTLSEIDQEIKAISAAKKLNLNSNWEQALSELNEIDTQLKSIESGKRINLQSSWTRFLEELEETKRDIDNAKQQDIKRFKSVLEAGPRYAQRKTQQQEEAARALEIARAPKSDITGFLGKGIFGPQFAKGSPGAAADMARRRGEGLSNALIGGVFPALFGQGLGASAGGAAGGFGGGMLGGGFGFGLSLAGTAIGAQIDAAIQKLNALGKALEDPAKNFQALADAGLTSSKAFDRSTAALIETGRQAEAAAAIERDLANTFGDTKAAEDLAQKTDELNRAWSQLTVTLTSVLAGPLSELAKQLSGSLSGAQRQASGNGSSRDFAGLTFDSISLFSGATSLGNFITAPIVKGLTGIPTLRDLVTSPFSNKRPTTKTDRPVRSASDALIEKKAKEDILALTIQQAAADAQGNQELSKKTQLDTIEANRRLKIANLGPKKDPAQIKQINEDAQIQKAGINERYAQNQRDLNAQSITAANRVRDIQGQAALEQRRLFSDSFAFARRSAEEQVRAADRAVDSAKAAAAAKPQDASRQQAVDEAVARADAARVEAHNKIVESYRQEKALQASIADQIAASRDNTAIAQLSGGMSGEGRGALQGLGALRATAAAAREAKRQLAENPEDKRLQGAAQLASARLVEAGADFRRSLQDAFRSARDAVTSIKRGLEDGAAAIARMKGGTSGVNSYLSGQGLAERQRGVFLNRLPEFYKVRAEGAERLAREGNFEGARQLRNTNFSGSFEQVNAQIEDFIQQVRAEGRAGQDQAKGEQETLPMALKSLNTVVGLLTAPTQQLVDVNKTLATQIQQLAGKDWNVYVTPPAPSSPRLPLPVATP